jgi:hypothetical protein
MKHIYRNENGTEVPTVTTVLSQIHKPHLITWAAKLASRGMDWELIRNEAAETGSLVHSMIESFIKQESVDYSNHPFYSKAQKAYQAFINWTHKRKVEFIGSEISLVETGKQFGGTIDIIANVDGILSVIDIKTSSSLCEEYDYQIAAYRYLLEYAQLDDKGFARAFSPYQSNQALLLRVDKYKGTFEEKIISDFQTPQAIFFLLLDVWHRRFGVKII